MTTTSERSAWDSRAWPMKEKKILGAIFFVLGVLLILTIVLDSVWGDPVNASRAVLGLTLMAAGLATIVAPEGLLKYRKQ